MHPYDSTFGTITTETFRTCLKPRHRSTIPLSVGRETIRTTFIPTDFSGHFTLLRLGSLRSLLNLDPPLKDPKQMSSEFMVFKTETPYSISTIKIYLTREKVTISGISCRPEPFLCRLLHFSFTDGN